MEAVFSYIIGLGAAVMMPIIFTILGVCIGINIPKPSAAACAWASASWASPL